MNTTTLFLGLQTMTQTRIERVGDFFFRSSSLISISSSVPVGKLNMLRFSFCSDSFVNLRKACRKQGLSPWSKNVSWLSFYYALIFL